MYGHYANIDGGITRCCCFGSPDSKLSMASETLHSRFLNATNGSSCSVHSIILSKSQCRGLDMYRYIRDDQFLFRVAIGIRFPVLDSCKLYGISQDELVVQW